MGALRQPRGRCAEVEHTGLGSGSMHLPPQGPALVNSVPAKKSRPKPKRGPTSKKHLGKLTYKQLMFCAEFPVDFNITQAAIRAGYSKKSAHQIGWRLLRTATVLEKIEYHLRKRVKDAEARGDDEWRRIAEIAFGQLTDLVSWDMDGVTVIPSEELTAKGRATVKEFAIYDLPEGGSKTVVKGRDPLPALKLLAERREKEKAATQGEEGPQHMGTIFYFDAGATAEPKITAANDSDDDSGAD